MADTDLNNILHEIYGESTVSQMLSGKAYSRALCAHLIVNQVLSSMIFENWLSVITNILMRSFKI